MRGGSTRKSVSARGVVEEDLLDIRAGIKAGRYVNEATVSQGVVQRPLNALGWPVYDTEIVAPESERSIDLGEISAYSAGLAGVVWTLDGSVDLNANLVRFGAGRLKAFEAGTSRRPRVPGRGRERGSGPGDG